MSRVPTLRARPKLHSLEARLVPALVINELYVNPPGIDDNREFIELRETTGVAVSYPNIGVVEIQGNPTGAGIIAGDVHLAGFVTGTNGMLLIGPGYGSLGHPWGALVPSATNLSDMTSQMGNDNTTILLVEGYTGSVGQDLDLNDDGTLDVTPWTNVLDSIGWHDPSVPGGKVYTTATLAQATLSPDAASRFSNNVAPNAASAWYNGEILALGGVPDMSRSYDSAKSSGNLPAGAAITPGDANFATALPQRVSGITINDGAVQRSRVTTLTVTFDQTVVLPANPADAFQLVRQGDGAPVLLSALQSGNAVNLSFTGGAVDADSLADGRYTLTAFAAQINAGELDGDGNGTAGDNYVLIGDPSVAPKLFRLFGDNDGDSDVDTSDFGAFRIAFGGVSGIFDFDNDGDVDVGDFGQLRARFGTTI